MRPFLLLAVVALAKAAPPIGILPVTDCPNDTSDPVVILASTINGQPLAANQYIVCVAGEPSVLECPEGLFFNYAKLTCDFPYERRRSVSESQGSPSDTTSELGDLDNLVPAGPIPVPISPQYPIPIWTKSSSGVIRPLPPYPITKPDPTLLQPVPVQNKLPPLPSLPEIPVPIPPLPPVPHPPEIPVPPFPIPAPVPSPPEIPVPPFPLPVPSPPEGFIPRIKPVRSHYPPVRPVPLPDDTVFPMPPVIPARPPPLIPRPVPYE